MSGPRLPRGERAVGLELTRRAAGARGASALFVSRETDDKPAGDLPARWLERVDRETRLRTATSLSSEAAVDQASWRTVVEIRDSGTR